MATRHNTSPSLLLIARLIDTKEGLVWRVQEVITGTGDLEGIARDHTTENCVPVIVPMTGGHRHAYWTARRRIDGLVERMNALAGL